MLKLNISRALLTNIFFSEITLATSSKLCPLKNKEQLKEISQPVYFLEQNEENLENSKEMQVAQSC